MIVDIGPAIVLGVATAIYAVGVRRAWSHAGVGRAMRTPQIASFAVAIGVLGFALLSPLDAMSHDLFAAHMTQHVLLAVVAPPFLVLGAPAAAAVWAMPVRGREVLVVLLRRRAWIGRAWSTATVPSVAWLAHAAAIWIWHAPRAYSLALESEPMHALEHLSFVGTAVLLWWGIIHPRIERRSGYGIGIIAIFATAMHTGVLGALLALSHRVLYTGQTSVVAPWGLTPLDDQQLAGLIMWVPGGLLYVVAMSVLFVRWIQPPRLAGRAVR